MSWTSGARISGSAPKSPPPSSEKLISRGATELLIGRFNAHYRIWVDGELIAHGIGRSEADPVIFPLPSPA